MAQRNPHADPYMDSGHSAAHQSVLRMKCEALQSSISDADDLRRRGLRLLKRSARLVWAAYGAMVAPVLAGIALGIAASNTFDNTYEGVTLASWAVLGCFICLGVFSFASSWYSRVRRLRETAQRLLVRAEYQHRMAALRLSEIEHEAVR